MRANLHTEFGLVVQLGPNVRYNEGCNTRRRKSGTAKRKRPDMTARRSQSTEQKHHQRFVLPDPPEREPEDMTSFDHLTLNGSAHHLVQHLGNPQTTLVAGERYITLEPGAPSADRMDPDLLVAFNADVQTYRDSNGYVISEQGKPPDFVMEIASRSTSQHDVVDKRPAYASLGIPEY